MPTTTPLPKRTTERLRHLSAAMQRGEAAAEERSEIILRLREEGFTYRAIGDALGVTPQAVFAVTKRARAEHANEN